MNNLFNLSFWKTFSRFLLIGLSAFVLLAAAQQSIIGDFSQKGPQQVLADSDNCQTDGSCSNPGVLDLPIDLPSEPVQPAIPQAPSQPAPVVQQQPIPACNEDVRYCDANVGRTIHKTGGYYEPTHSLADARGCVYAFVQENACGQPAPQPAAPQPAPAAPQGGGQACQPGGWSAVSCSVCNAQGTGMNADGSDWGTYDGRYGSWCGCAQKFSNINNFPQCGNPAPSQPAPAPVQQPQQPVVTASLPQCNTLANNLICGQKAYDTCTEFTQNGKKYFNCYASQNSNCTGIIECSQVSGGPAKTADQKTQCPNGTTQIVASNNVITCISNVNQNQNTVTNNNNSNAVVSIPGGINNRVETVRTEVIRTEVACPDGTTRKDQNGRIICEPIVRTAELTCPVGTFKTVIDRQVVCEVTRKSAYTTTFAGAKELPKTGLPALAWAVGAFVPLGVKLKKFAKGAVTNASSPLFIWESRQFRNRSIS